MIFVHLLFIRYLIIGIIFPGCSFIFKLAMSYDIQHMIFSDFNKKIINFQHFAKSKGSNNIETNKPTFNDQNLIRCNKLNF